MTKPNSKYFNELTPLFKKIAATDEKGKSFKFEEAIKTALKMINGLSDSNRKLIFIGNGASAAISSHMATDFWKNGGIRALAFNDSSLLTCVSNDYGYRFISRTIK